MAIRYEWNGEWIEMEGAKVINITINTDDDSWSNAIKSRSNAIKNIETTFERAGYARA